MAALKPYEVDNAVILAAGLSSRFAPISYELPKGLLKVRGEVLIERQIEQLKAAGINDIVKVVGYKKESYFYLEEQYGVKIVISRSFAERNNTSSLMLVREVLGNTYVFHEFDSLDELRGFDPLFLENVDSGIFDNICAVLGCSKPEIRDVYPLKQGLTNLSCHFTTDDGEWVYHHPGTGTELMIDRKAEKTALEAATKLGLDDTFVFENPRRGWKISRFVPDCKNLDSRDDEQLKTAMQMARAVHESGAKVDRRFSFYDEGRTYEQTLLAREPISVAD